MRKVVTGDQVAQIYNRDPLALPVWRAPVYRTPAAIIAIAQLCRFTSWLVRLVFRHPVVSLVLAVLGWMWAETGWLGVTLLLVWAVVVLAGWRCCGRSGSPGGSLVRLVRRGVRGGTGAGGRR